MRFYILPRHGKEMMFEATLIEAGYKKAYDIRDSDFVLTHYDLDGWRWFVGGSKGPIFMYPHSVDCWYHYDINGQPWDKIKYNFVISDTVKMLEKKLGYPNPTTVIGFPYCKIKPLNTILPSHRKPRILWAPAHADDLGWIAKDEATANADIFSILKELSNDYNITIYHFGEIGKSNIIYDDRIKYVYSDGYIAQALWQIHQSDIIIGRGTFLHLGVAMGKPTVSFLEDMIFHEVQCPEDKMRHPILMKYWKYPFDLLKSGSISDILSIIDIAISGNDAFSTWKTNIIGFDFDKELFINTIKENL